MTFLQRVKAVAPNWMRLAWRKALAAQAALQEQRKQARLRADAKRNRLSTPTPKLVVFVSDIPRSREAKIAFGLKQQGWDVILLYKQNPSFEPLKFCRAAEHYASPQEALELCLKYRPVVYHVFSNWNFHVAEHLIRFRPGKIVFDNYDVLAGMLQEDFLKTLPGYAAQEKYCLEEANGLCCRGLETQYLKRERGYRYRGKRLLFLDWCWNRPNEPLKDKSAELGVVYCGGIFPKPSRAPNSEGDFLAVAKLLCEAKVHFHIFPQPAPPQEDFGTYFDEYVHFAENNPYFHFHKPVPPDDLIRELSGNTAGLQFGGVGIELPLTGSTNHPRRVGYCTANKLFDYLDADLPIIVWSAKLQRWISLRYGSGVRASERMFREPVAFLQEVQETQKNVRRAREAYAIEKQIPRLVQFYSSL